MSKEKKNRKFSFITRTIVLSCTLLLVGCVIYISFVGLSLFSGILLATALAGVAGPGVASGDGIIDIFVNILELIVESVQSIFEAIIDIISSIFG